jgi:ABC-type multidrug transport system fused ATPase/permease subunit
MFRLIFFVYAGLSASRHMHANLFHSVIYAPMAFFDTTPLGRVMARFSKDVDAVDFNLASQLGNLAMTVFLILGSILSIIYATPWFGVAVIPIFVVYWYVATYFRNVSRECKRVDSVTRSPIYAHFGETLGGLSTIRAYGQSSRFANINEAYVNTNTSAFYTLRSCDRWLSIRLEILGNTIVLLSAILSAATAESDAASGQTAASGTVGTAALAGFALSFSLTITSVMSWAVRTLAETENMMNSVERIIVTTEETPQEPQGRDEATPKVGDSWASKGEIAFKSVKMRYRDDSPEVLHGVDFAVKAGEKVGIVGRSGSGKSSIMQVLFRIPVDGCVGGKVEVDGVDTKAVSLHTLRHRLSIIPQESVMFSGMLRDNLDPANEVRDRAKAEGFDADKRMMQALVDVGLEETVAKKGGLDAKVAEFGENWSAGERQLLSLARVLLRDTKILCLDEVSSSVDSDTDKRMHETIQTRFADRTVLTIAHRLHTVIGSDRVIVMHEGVVVEFDHPHTLLSDATSRFSMLVADTGAAAEGLKELARQSWISSHPGAAAAVAASDVSHALDDDSRAGSSDSV